MVKIKPYNMVIIGVVFDEGYTFKDILMLGISNSPMESNSIVMDYIMRLYEDFNTDDVGNSIPIEYSESRSEYDEPIIVIKFNDGFAHLYCLALDEDTNDEDED